MHHRIINAALVALCCAVAAWIVYVGNSTRSLLLEMKEAQQLSLIGARPQRNPTMICVSTTYTCEATGQTYTCQGTGETQEEARADLLAAIAIAEELTQQSGGQGGGR